MVVCTEVLPRPPNSEHLESIQRTYVRGATFSFQTTLTYTIEIKTDRRALQDLSYISGPHPEYCLEVSIAAN